MGRAAEARGAAGQEVLSESKSGRVMLVTDKKTGKPVFFVFRLFLSP